MASGDQRDPRSRAPALLFLVAGLVFLVASVLGGTGGTHFLVLAMMFVVVALMGWRWAGGGATGHRFGSPPWPPATGR